MRWFKICSNHYSTTRYLDLGSGTDGGSGSRSCQRLHLDLSSGTLLRQWAKMKIAFKKNIKEHKLQTDLDLISMHSAVKFVKGQEAVLDSSAHAICHVYILSSSCGTVRKDRGPGSTTRHFLWEQLACTPRLYHTECLIFNSERAKLPQKNFKLWSSLNLKV